MKPSNQCKIHKTVCLIFWKVMIQLFGKLLLNPLESQFSILWKVVVQSVGKKLDVVVLQQAICRQQWDLKVKVSHYLKGDSESGYGEVTTLTEQVCPGNCHRQVLEMAIVITYLYGASSSLYENLYVSVDELNRQVSFLDKAVDCPDVKSNIAQRYCAVHGKLNEIQGQKCKEMFFTSLVVPGRGIWCHRETCPSTC